MRYSRKMASIMQRGDRVIVAIRGTHDT
jgi:hypothetical protein